MIVRPAALNDLISCEKLAKDPMLEFPSGENPTREYMAHYLDDTYFLVAEEDTSVIGFILGEPLKNNGARLWFFIVDRNHRRKGVAKKLFAEFEGSLKKNNRKWIFLTAHIHNEAALNLYKNYGFVKGKPHFEMMKSI